MLVYTKPANSQRYKWILSGQNSARKVITHARVHFILQTSGYHRISQAWVANQSAWKWIFSTSVPPYLSVREQRRADGPQSLSCGPVVSDAQSRCHYCLRLFCQHSVWHYLQTEPRLLDHECGAKKQKSKTVALKSGPSGLVNTWNCTVEPPKVAATEKKKKKHLNFKILKILKRSRAITFEILQYLVTLTLLTPNIRTIILNLPETKRTLMISNFSRCLSFLRIPSSPHTWHVSGNYFV